MFSSSDLDGRYSRSTPPLLLADYRPRPEKCRDCKGEFIKNAPTHVRCVNCKAAATERKVARNAKKRRAKASARRTANL